MEVVILHILGKFQLRFVYISGVYVKVKGKRDTRCSIVVANYVTCLDSLAAAHTLRTISVSIVH